MAQTLSPENEEKLINLIGACEGLTARELADKLHLHPATVRKTLAHLIEARLGLVYYVEGQNHARKWYLG
jgi:predicted ArsR family transcriptional regulator